MEDNRTSIKKRLDDIFIEKMGYLVNRLTNDQRSKSLLSDSAGMQARDLLKLYMELENEFHIDFASFVIVYIDTGFCESIVFSGTNIFFGVCHASCRSLNQHGCSSFM